MSPARGYRPRMILARRAVRRLWGAPAGSSGSRASSPRLRSNAATPLNRQGSRAGSNSDLFWLSNVRRLPGWHLVTEFVTPPVPRWRPTSEILAAPRQIPGPSSPWWFLVCPSQASPEYDGRRILRNGIDKR
jgi:hypothetical protein